MLSANKTYRKTDGVIVPALGFRLISCCASGFYHAVQHDRVIVKRLEEERKTASGIVIPDTVAEKPDQGEILAVGNGKVGDDGKVRPLDVKVGDKVLFGKYSGQTVKVDGEELLVMREEDIMAVVGK